MAAGPLRSLVDVLQSISDQRFFPDATRSGYWKHSVPLASPWHEVEEEEVVISEPFLRNEMDETMPVQQFGSQPDLFEAAEPRDDLSHSSFSD